MFITYGYVQLILGQHITICTCTCIHTFIIHVYRFIYTYICLAMRVIADDRVLSDLWCCCCCCFCFCLTLHGGEIHSTPATNHQPPHLCYYRLVLWGLIYERRVPPPFVRTNERTNEYRKCHAKKIAPFSGPSPPSTSGCVTDKPPTPLLHPFRASRRWPLGTGYVFTITNSMRPRLSFLVDRSFSLPLLYLSFCADLHGEMRESCDDLKGN